MSHSAHDAIRAQADELIALLQKVRGREAAHMAKTGVAGATGIGGVILGPIIEKIVASLMAALISALKDWLEQQAAGA